MIAAEKRMKIVDAPPARPPFGVGGKSTPASIERFPSEICDLILDHLAPVDLLRASGTCSLWRRLTDSRWLPLATTVGVPNLGSSRSIRGSVARHDNVGRAMRRNDIVVATLAGESPFGAPTVPQDFMAWDCDSQRLNFTRPRVGGGDVFSWLTAHPYDPASRVIPTLHQPDCKLTISRPTGHYSLRQWRTAGSFGREMHRDVVNNAVGAVIWRQPHHADGHFFNVDFIDGQDGPTACIPRADGAAAEIVGLNSGEIQQVIPLEGHRFISAYFLPGARQLLTFMNPTSPPREPVRGALFDRGSGALIADLGELDAVQIWGDSEGVSWSRSDGMAFMLALRDKTNIRRVPAPPAADAGWFRRVRWQSAVSCAWLEGDDFHRPAARLDLSRNPLAWTTPFSRAELREKRLSCLKWDPRGQRLSATRTEVDGSKAFIVVDTSTKATLLELPCEPDASAVGWWAPSGSRLIVAVQPASARGQDGASFVALFDLSRGSGERLRDIPCGARCSYADWSPDEEKVALHTRKGLEVAMWRRVQNAT